MIRWSAFIHVIFYMGALFQVAYLSEPGKRIMGIWVFLGLILVPFLLLRAEGGCLPGGKRGRPRGCAVHDTTPRREPT